MTLRFAKHKRNLMIKKREWKNKGLKQCRNKDKKQIDKYSRLHVGSRVSHTADSGDHKLTGTGQKAKVHTSAISAKKSYFTSVARSMTTAIAVKISEVQEMEALL